MPFPTPAYGAGPTTGSITAFTKQPSGYDPIFAPRPGLAGGKVVTVGLDGVRFKWRVLTQTQFDNLQNHYDSAASAGGLYAVTYWKWTTSAVATTTCYVDMPPTHSEIKDNNYHNVVMEFMALDRP